LFTRLMVQEKKRKRKEKEKKKNLMSLVCFGAFHVFQAKLTNMKLVGVRVFFWVGRVVPSINLVLPEFYLLYVFNLGNFFVLLFKCGRLGVEFFQRLKGQG